MPAWVGVGGLDLRIYNERGERDRDRESERDRHIDRQADRQTGR